MIYNELLNGEKSWLVIDDRFDERYLGKTEAIMNIGNGYLGSRCATEERYVGEVRDTFISGTFNKFDEFEVTELPNVADTFNFDFYINGERFSLAKGQNKDYKKVLNLKTGEVTRSFVWTHEDLEIKFNFRRFASLSNQNLVVQKISIIPNKEIQLDFETGINGQLSNSGSQHFHEGEKRFYDEMTIMEMLQTTVESKIDFVLNTTLVFNQDLKKDILMDRRKISTKFSGAVSNELEVTKYTTFNTTRDKVHAEKTLETLRSESLDVIRGLKGQTYSELLDESAAEWAKYWETMNVEIEGDDYALLAYRFAMYHMRVFTPYHDERMNCGAKGLSGEGYKGHTFWDTELFIFPVYVFKNPDVARNLLKYRYLGLEGARRKAAGNGYKGAQYPWEAAWITDGEVTPVWGAPDIITGKSTKIWSGFIEQHITSDVVYATWLYYNATGDEDFMEKYGYEMIFDTANFWSTRGEWDGERYNINDVIGPDEYKEHCNNNAFTNHTAKWNCDLALSYLEKLQGTETLENIKKKIEVLDEQWTHFAEHVYLPMPNEDNIVPQDDGYLTYPTIDLTKYKNQEHVGGLFKEYNLEQVNKMQVSKQADIMVLFLLLENLFSKDVKVANFKYYEPKTLHDSSLSLSTHVILASDLEDKDLAYSLFQKAVNIDMGPYMKSSDHGIHAASLAGIWQSVVYGFGGVRYYENILRIEPKLPVGWTKLKFDVEYLGQNLEVLCENGTATIKNNGDKAVNILNNGKTYLLEKEVVINYS